MAGYNIVFRQLDVTIVAGIINVKSTLEFSPLKFKSPVKCKSVVKLIFPITSKSPPVLTLLKLDVPPTFKKNVYSD